MAVDHLAAALGRRLSPSGRAAFLLAFNERAANRRSAVSFLAEGALDLKGAGQVLKEGQAEAFDDALALLVEAVARAVQGQERDRAAALERARGRNRAAGALAGAGLAALVVVPVAGGAWWAVVPGVLLQVGAAWPWWRAQAEQREAHRAAGDLAALEAARTGLLAVRALEGPERRAALFALAEAMVTSAEGAVERDDRRDAIRVVDAVRIALFAPGSRRR